MIRKMFIITTLFLFAFIMFGEVVKETDRPPPPSPGENIASILLDSIVVGFNKLAMKGAGAYNPVNDLLQESMARLNKARTDKNVDEIFYARYKRILVVLKLAIMDRKDDTQGILSDLIGKEMQAFAFDITGEIRDMHDPKKRGIASIAKAIIWEILNLHIHLDTKDNRGNLMRKYFKTLPPPPAVKKKNKDK